MINKVIVKPSNHTTDNANEFTVHALSISIDTDTIIGLNKSWNDKMHCFFSLISPLIKLSLFPLFLQCTINVHGLCLENSSG